MRFCPQCSSVMTKSTSVTGSIVFQCVCRLIIEGQDDDSLMAQGFLETAESNLKHEVFIENSPYDPAANVVLKDCPQCGLNFMVMVRIGAQETTMFSCRCGYKATNDEYMKAFEKDEGKPNVVSKKTK
ncbi:Hypothetical protein PACV_157 [Pacmanvirus A23]|uniref:Hypothetical protein n=1 Tax=Pacmanvirus A23 TaxID=1932881 RepID=UPI000A096401|nr:Hypothetical protein B9W72_gp155 [Pacmanvirus A23]SIP85872.1 Hypothetical protein PACV_157 [Pacmanvirus A23]